MALKFYVPLHFETSNCLNWIFSKEVESKWFLLHFLDDDDDDDDDEYFDDVK